jgi:predicted nucleic acid-binding protein
VAKHLILDANILMRAVLGVRAADIIRRYTATAIFLTVEEAFEDATLHIPVVLARRGTAEATIQAALEKLDALRPCIQVIAVEALVPLESAARERLRGRDEDDWPFLALALFLDCPLWTEDRDFFGCGIPLWTTDRVEIYLAQIVPP